MNTLKKFEGRFTSSYSSILKSEINCWMCCPFQASGVTIADECKQQFEAIKRDKKAR